MHKIKDGFKKHRKYFWIGLVVLILVLIIFRPFGGNKNKNGVEFSVLPVNLEQSVELSGKIETSDKAELGFASSGRIGRIFVKNNQKVEAGTVLAQLEIGDLLADLKIKQASLETSNIDLDTAKEELEKITRQEDTKVSNALREMLSEGLDLEPNSSSYTAEDPEVTGLYEGEAGRYKLRVKKEDPTSSKYELLTFDLETTTTIINKEGQTKLGTKGLYISFPGDISSYEDTIWYLDIPNKGSSEYLSNFNAYNDAKNARDLAIKTAEANYQKLLAEDGGGSVVANAEIEKINAEIRKNTIYAPFPGIVTNIEKEVGENASVGELVISILGEEKLEAVLQVSELDVSKLVPGMSIGVMLDAFPDEVFEGVLETVNSKETTIDGVPVYEAFVNLTENQRIKNGMSATGLVVFDKRENVLAVPSYMIAKKDGKNFVKVLDTNGKYREQEVVLGLLGSDSMIEVISGLKEGDKIVSNGQDKK